MDPTRVLHLVSRADSSPVATPSFNTGNAQLDKLLELLQGSFSSTVTTTSFIASLGTSLAISAAILALFCFLRPLNNVVYAPRAKYADSKHVPPPVPKHPLGWVTPVIKTKEMQLAEILGLDATVFLRFARMNRYMFTVLAVIGCAILIPANLVGGHSVTNTTDDPIMKLGPRYIADTRVYWAYVVAAYLFNITICFFLWRNYRAVVRLRRSWFDSAEYQHSLAARTLLVMELPKDSRSDQGIVQIAEQTLRTSDVPRAAIARNVKELPELVEEHTKAVEQLEEVLANYLKNPNKMPAQRPTCEIHKKDAAYQRGKKVDAIEYLSGRIQQLERQVKETRQSIDTRNAMNYGFASYQKIDDAHSVAYAARKGGARKTMMRLAPKPHDIIWQNLPMTSGERKRANFVNNFWVALLTVAWIVPNVFSAVFLANLQNLAAFWPAFKTSLFKHPKLWGVVQGVAAPAVQTLFFYFLPAIFRRLSIKAGDVTKTSRDRHVLHKLFAFFVFNNLFVYSLFSALWGYIAVVVANSKSEESAEQVFKELKSQFQRLIMFPLEQMSMFWLTWLMQRNLGAAIDLAQLVNLAWGSFSRRYRSPTPRQLIKLSAPQPFDYTGYYNYFLFYGTVALCYAPFQPLTLVVTAAYFWIDSHMKKYLLMYVFITKTESGGKFWRVLFNRVLCNALFGTLVIALVVGVQGKWIMAVCVAPLPFLLLGFKFYCKSAFDDKIDYYSTKVNAERDIGTGEHKSKGADKVAVKFGHPVLYKRLITPLVHAKAQHLLKSIYTGRTSLDMDDPTATGGYSDMYMNPMSHNHPGKAAKPDAPFEVVGESELDFAHFKNRAEFRDEAGGDGELYGRSADMIRRGSEQSNMTNMTDMRFGGRAGTPQGYRPDSRSGSISSERTRVEGGSSYPAGYHAPGGVGGAVRNHSVDSYSNASDDLRKPGSRGDSRGRDESRTDLLRGAARMGRSPEQRDANGQYRSGSQGPMMRGWQMGDGITPGSRGSPGEDTSYDYFRRGRQ
ncbi:DUF221-domain-containing protein [Myriangium duriaei CBS 260.36]|uniref:DUF221-domain-containing protein n=1 Tax=Myriangium duriaei CBS 260.36 TaxID=1168546 RepID=A0A9P4J5S4_9PEZI|nr:DUF221-domain-containing protein [Myriangium duriaei CBS 260.36]